MRETLITLLLVLLVACGSSSANTTNSVESAQPATVEEPTTTSTAATSTPSSTVLAVPQPQVVIEPEAVVRSITVGGMGAEYAEPVRCIIDIGVSSRSDTVAASGAEASAAGQAITDTLTAAGVNTDDIQTSEFSVYPFYDDYPAIAGYETHIGYRVALPDVDGVGAVLAAAMNAGGDDVRAWGVRFEADPTGLIESAREAAWEDVMERAESLAGLAGEPLGELLDAHEKVLVSTTQGMHEGGEGDVVTFDVPVSPGVSGVVVLLTVTFAIGE